MPTSPHAYINNRQIKHGQYGRNKETGEREFQLYRHTSITDKNGEKIRMVHIMLPNLAKRMKVHGKDAIAFGKDSNGIDRDARSAYIQIPLVELKEYKKFNQGKEEKSNLKVWYFNNPNMRVNVYFESQKYDVERGHSNWNKFDKPERVQIGVRELMCIFPTTREQLRALASQKKDKEISNKEISQQIDKGVAKDTKQRDDRPSQTRSHKDIER